MEYMDLLEKAKKNLPNMTANERFEMPFAIVNHTGKYTIIKDFSEIAKRLRRDAVHIAKFLFKELAVPGEIKGNELILQGRVSGNLINQRLHEYVKRFVLCHECGKADTVIKKSERIYFIKCEVCGANRAIS